MTESIIINAHYQRAIDLGQVAAALGWVGLSLIGVVVVSLVLGSVIGACVAAAIYWAVSYVRQVYEHRSEQELILMWAEEKRRPS
jgi:uncharacterized protein (DUF697 family)